MKGFFLLKLKRMNRKMSNSAIMMMCMCMSPNIRGGPD